MRTWAETRDCALRVHCWTCRTNAGFAASVAAPEVCPHGITAENIPPLAFTGGPGTELKKLLASVGIVARAGCKCLAMAAKMDAWGPDGCETNLAEIVAVMTEEAARRDWLRLAPFKELGAELLVRRAISAAKDRT